MTAPYGAARARRSLGHYLVGRGAAALLGLAWLLWLVRTLPAAEYGTYVALLALVEIFYLATGFGLSTVAQRYVAEFRLRAPARQFRRFLLGLLLRRLVYAAAGALMLAALMGPLLRAWDIALAPGAHWGFLAWLVAGSVTRYLDELLPALLLQGLAQGLALAGNVARLVFAGLTGGQGTGHAALVWLEAGIALALAGAGVVLLLGYLRRHPGLSDGAAHAQPGMWPTAGGFWLVQLMGQAWSGNAARLLVSRAAGAAATASFGLCLALVEMLRNYLPAYLLAHWVRPLMVARWVEHRSLAPVMPMANAVLKLSWLMVLPVAAFFCGHGDALAAWVSGGRYREGAGLLLALLAVWAALQCLHLLIGMLTATLERAAPNLWATALACAALPIGLALLPVAGVAALAAMLLLAELFWVGFVLTWMARQGLALRFDVARGARIVGLAVLAALAALAWPATEGPALLLPLAACCAIVWGGALLLRPFAHDELALMRQALPARWRA